MFLGVPHGLDSPLTALRVNGTHEAESEPGMSLFLTAIGDACSPAHAPAFFRTLPDGANTRSASVACNSKSQDSSDTSGDARDMILESPVVSFLLGDAASA